MLFLLPVLFATISVTGFSGLPRLAVKKFEVLFPPTVDCSVSWVRLIFLFVSFVQGTWVSMGVYSDGSYGIPENLFYSFPVTCKKGKWSIVQGKFIFVQTVVSFIFPVTYFSRRKHFPASKFRFYK